MPVATGTNRHVLDWLRQRGIRIVATTPAATIPYTAVPLTGPVALVMGGEAHGLSAHWLSAADKTVVIPMHGVANSLNLSVAAALLMYEVVRQRTENR